MIRRVVGGLIGVVYLACLGMVLPTDNAAWIKIGVSAVAITMLVIVNRKILNYLAMAAVLTGATLVWGSADTLIFLYGPTAAIFFAVSLFEVPNKISHHWKIGLAFCAFVLIFSIYIHL